MSVSRHALRQPRDVTRRLLGTLTTRTIAAMIAVGPVALHAQAAASGGFQLRGTLGAKPGTRLVVSLNGGDTLVITAAANGTATFTSTPFAFTRKLADGGTYAAAIKRAPAGVRCLASNGEGTVSGASPMMRITCGVEWDLVSRSSDDKHFSTLFESGATPSIGGMGVDDGRYVAFASEVAGIAGSLGKHRQVFWRDRQTGVTKLVSKAADGAEGNQDSIDPSISADGKSVAFESSASNLIGADTNGQHDVFVWREATGAIERVSTGSKGEEANGGGSEASISGDGTFVAFTSSSALFPSMKGSDLTNVFLKDTKSGELRILSVDASGRKGGGSSRPSISEDGARVAFHSGVALTKDDGNTLWDIFVWDRTTGALTRVSRTAAGAERDQGQESQMRVVAPAISGDGHWVTFSTTASNMTSEGTKLQQVYLASADGGSVKRLSTTKDGATGDNDSPIQQGERVGISYDGRWVVFTSNATNLGASIVAKNTSTGAIITLVPLGARIGRPDISRDGTYIIVGVGERKDPRFPSSGIFVKMR